MICHERERHRSYLSGCHRDGNAVADRHPDRAADRAWPCFDPLGESSDRGGDRDPLCQYAARNAAGHIAAAAVFRASQYRSADSSDLGGDPGAGHEYVGLQLRGVAVRTDELSKVPVRGGAVGRHAGQATLSQDRLATDRAREPSRSRQRNVPADQGHAGTRGCRGCRHHARRRQDWRPDLRAAAAASGGGSAVRVDRVCAGVAAALDRTAPDRGRGCRMIHDFGIVWNERALLLNGLANTAILSTLAAIAALLLGFILTPALMSKRQAVSGAARMFVDGMRCVPFLLFAYIVYYGLPSFGVRLDNWTSGLAALTIYDAAYMAEILRGAWVVQPREPIEAGIAFGFSEIRLFRRIILPPLLLSAGPVIGNQMIQIIKDSAFLTIIALPELTHAASSIQSRHYVPFAAFITAVFLYWGLCLVIEAGVSSIGRVAEARR